MNGLALHARAYPRLHELPGWFATLRAAWQRKRVYDQTYTALNRLSSVELADMGVSRSMISRLAHEAATGAAPGHEHRE